MDRLRRRFPHEVIKALPDVQEITERQKLIGIGDSLPFLPFRHGGRLDPDAVAGQFPGALPLRQPARLSRGMELFPDDIFLSGEIRPETGGNITVIIPGPGHKNSSCHGKDMMRLPNGASAALHYKHGGEKSQSVIFLLRKLFYILTSLNKA